MIGGKVSANPIASSTNATMLTRPIFTSRAPHFLSSTYHAVNQMTIAENGHARERPRRVVKLEELPIPANASPSNANSPSTAQPIPAARIAAAPGPLGSSSRAPVCRELAMIILP